jgi:hypothetical protein
MIAIRDRTVANNIWSAPVSDGNGLIRRDAGLPPGRAPISIWTKLAQVPRLIVLIGHGGSRHRRAESVVMMAQAVLDKVPAYVAAIDGPLHGDRLRGLAQDTVSAFAALWQTESGGVRDMADDWHAALIQVRALPGAAELPIGYYGVSMGTAFGLPFLAEQPMIGAASLGMWDASFSKSERLLAIATRVQCSVLFQHRERDEYFSREGALRLFDSIGSSDKRFVPLQGSHGESADQLQIAAEFLIRRLTYEGTDRNARSSTAGSTSWDAIE